MKYIPIILFFIFAVVLFFSLIKNDEKKQNITIIELDREAPLFELPSIYNDSEGLKNSDLKGKYSLLNVFASWCFSCIAEHPELIKIKDTYNIPLYGLNWKDETQNAINWLQKLGNPYDKIGADKNGKIIVQLGVTGAPETFLVNPEGKIILRFPGPINVDVFKNHFLPLIKLTEYP